MSIHIEELISAFREEGHDVIIVAPTSEGSKSGFRLGSIVSGIRQLLPRVFSELLEVYYDRVAFRRLEKAYLAHKPDILYERYSLFLSAGEKLKNRYGIPFVLEVNAPLAQERAAHGGLALRRLAKSIEQRVWQSADLILPVSTALAEQIKSVGIDSKRIQIVPNGVNQRIFHPSPARPDLRETLGLTGRLVLGFSGYMRAWHDLDVIVEFIAEHGDLNVSALILGDGPAQKTVSKQASAAGVSDRVIFAGVIQRADIAEYMNIFDIALQPAAMPYASPLKLFEYLALGLPIVAPDMPNIREIVGDGDCAILFKPGDKAALNEALLKLCKDFTLRKKLAANAAALIDQKGYTWSNNARRIAALSKPLLNNSYYHTLS